MAFGRRGLLAGALACSLAPPLLRHARAADTDRFALGIASGQPRPDGMVLWTRLTGPALADRVAVQWEVAHDEAFTRVAARGTEWAEEDWAHSIHAEPAGLEPGRWYFYRFRALGQQSPVGRTRTTPAAAAREPLRFAIASCQRFDHGHYAAWREVAERAPDLVLFLGDYIYEYPAVPGRVRLHEGGLTRTLADYRARYALYKGDALLRAAHAAAPWLCIWDDHEVDNDYAALQGQDLDPAFPLRRAYAWQAYWEHMPFGKAERPTGAHWRLAARTDWGALARIHTLDDRQHRDAQACPRPGRGGSNTVARRDCAALDEPQRTLLGPEQERWLADGLVHARPWNLVAQQTLMARVAWRDPAGPERGAYWTDGWDGYPHARRRLLQAVAERAPRGTVVLGGDVHAHYVADLKADFDDERSPVVATEFCGTSISSEGLPQARLDGMRPFNPHLKLARSDRRGYVWFELGVDSLRADLRAVVDPRDPASAVESLGRFVVEAGRAGAVGG